MEDEKKDLMLHNLENEGSIGLELTTPSHKTSIHGTAANARWTAPAACSRMVSDTNWPIWPETGEGE